MLLPARLIPREKRTTTAEVVGPSINRGPGGGVIERFRDVAGAAGSAIAVNAGDRRLTYQQLDAASDAVASLVAERVGAGSQPVVILASHDEMAVVAVLGVLKAGRPFTVLDPTAPSERLRNIARLAHSPLCLFSEPHRDIAAVIGTSTPIEAPGTGTRAPKLTVTPDAPCSVVFTSGSTGDPKGVVRSHAATVSRALSESLVPYDRLAVVLPLSYSYGLSGLFAVLLKGASLHLLDPRQEGIDSLVTLLKDKQITQVWLTPALLRSLAHAAGSAVFESLESVVCAGDAVYGSDVATIRRCLPDSCVFFNMLGSSECGPVATFPIGFQDPVPVGPVPIGWAHPGVDIEVVDENGDSVRPGVVGEMVVTSTYVGDGYWRHSDLTIERFADVGDGRRRFRTGDLARRDADGLLHLAGRPDRLVKIGGYRVEPAEVEAALMELDEIAEAVVLGDRSDPGRTRLVGYVVPNTGCSPSTTFIRRFLRSRLPSFMVPERFVHLEEVPRNLNGKIDITRLLDHPAVQRSLIRPESLTSWQRAVHRIFASALDIETIGLHDDFFELGGDSLAAYEVIAALKEDFGKSITASDLIDAPTVAELAARIVAPAVEEKAKWRRTNQCLVPLQSGATHPPLFCVTGGGGSGLTLGALARRLSTDRPIYALQPHGLDERGFPDWTIQRTASRYVRVVSRVQADGPYLLAGYSSGCLVALEMAHQLSALGKEVSLVALFDPPVGSRRRKARLRGVAGDGDTYRAKLIGIRRRWRRYIGQKTAFPRHLAKALMTAVLTRPNGRTLDTHRRRFYRLARDMCRRYRSKPWPGRVVVYLAKQGTVDPDQCVHLFSGEWTIKWIPGSHKTILEEPNVTALAEDLSRQVDHAASVPSGLVRTDGGDHFGVHLESDADSPLTVSL